VEEFLNYRVQQNYINLNQNLVDSVKLILRLLQITLCIAILVKEKELPFQIEGHKENYAT